MSQDKATNAIKELSPAKLSLLDVLMKERSDAVASTPSRFASSASLRKSAALSFPQQRMWFLQLLDPQNPAYIISRAIRVKGPLQLEVLEHAIAELLLEHAILRTVYRDDDGVVRQYVCDPHSYNLTFCDLTSLDKDERNAEVERLVDQNQKTPFNLAEGPVIRFSALRLGPNDHIILFAVHHIAFDGWSMNLLFAELPALYEQSLNGKKRPAGTQKLQYADYAEWQQGWIESSAAERQLQYWSRQLGSFPANLILEQVAPDPPTGSSGGRESFTLPEQSISQIQAFANRHRLTSYMVYLATLMVLLHKYTGHSDLCVGSPVANRGMKETRDTVGMFVNTLAMRVTVLDDQPVDQFLEAIRKTVLEAFSNQEYPFERIVKELGPERAVGRHPLFQVMLVLQNGMSNVLRIPDCEVSFLENAPHTPIFDLAITLAEDGGTGQGWIEFNPTKFDQEFVKVIARHYRHLLDQLIADRECHIRDLSLLTSNELDRLSRWNQTMVPYSNRSVPDTILEQCQRTPEAIAVLDDEASLTYKQLAQLTGRLAAYLQGLGATANTTVGICAERSTALIVALLGILRTGSAYLPLDPAYPTQRLGYMVKDSGIRLLVTSSENLKHRFPHFDGEVVSLDRDKESIFRTDISPSISLLDPSSAMYLMYTSGSTGHPKGVVNTHEAISNRLRWMHGAYQGMSSGRVLQKTSISFDVSVWELFLPLMFGGTVVLAKPGAQADGQYLAEAIRAQQIETVHFVPSMLRAFLSTRKLELSCASLKWLICSGEELTRDLMENCLERLPAQVCNLYGPTEAAIDVTSWRCSRDWAGMKLPIGRPIDNMQIHILGSDMKPVPPSVIGEIYIGGVGVAQGYLNRPDLTRERFLRDPFSQRSNARMYKTGDLGCYNREGEILFYGRSDHQIKIRGNRIELEEIEAVCRSTEGIDDARVLALEYEPGDIRLAAYVVSREGSFNEQHLRAVLKATLPSFMLPAAIIRLDQLPLTANQKLDRDRLPKPGNIYQQTCLSEMSSNHRSIEGRVLAIWKSVLKIPSIALDDNFFDLGGHSLLLGVVKRLLEENVDTEVALLDLFTYPTVRSLSSYLSTKTL